jgi:NAD(P)-dependent dehydrogenase (short-subunit alcohol dehydrogenase family)
MQTAVITGANRGIGLALCKEFIGKGWHVIATCRNPDKATALQELQHPGSMDIQALEVTSPADVARMGKILSGRPVDVLVNNAGIMGGDHQGLIDMDFDAWEQTMNINVLAPFRISTMLLPNLRLSDRPRIVTISSQMGAFGKVMGYGQYAYRSSKAAVSKVMQVMALELQDEGIVVCPVHPGWVQTDMGGPSATITPQQSAQGLYTLIDGLNMQKSGRFWSWDGTEHVW